MQNDFVSDVRSRANGYWPSILERLAIPTNRSEGPCPACGGNTRYRFDNKDNRGTYFCSHCGAGTGLDLVMKVNQCGAREAAELVAEAMALPMPEPKPAREKPQTDIAGKVAALAVKASPGQSAYLTSKGLQCPFPMLSDGSLLLVLKNGAGATTGAQVIKPDGSKRLVAGTVKKGSFCVVNSGATSETVIIAEGLATALSVQQFRPDATIIAAIDAGNLLPVAQVMRKKYPNARIIIAADNDLSAESDRSGEVKVNTGKECAEKAAKAVAGWVSLPTVDYKADWNDYHRQNGLEAAIAAFNDSMYQPEGETVGAKLKVVDGGKKRGRGEINLIQMADNEKALMLADRYEGIAIHAESEAVYLYREGVWVKAAPLELSREMVAIYNENQTNFSKRSVNNVIEALKIVIPVMGQPRRSLIPFKNGVYDMETGTFSQHSLDNWLTNDNGVIYTPPEPGENLHDHAPNFHKWLSYTAGRDALKMKRIAAGLFMVLANRYDWQLFLEITGEGGSGKSVFTHIATMLAGEHNTASGNMAALDSARGRAQFVGKSMITLPDQPKYSGEGTGIKAITGGDAVEIDPKHEHQYTAVLRAVVVATNNTPMIFTERAGGVARRRVIFQFNNRVREEDKDPDLSEKISAEIPVIVRRLLANFSDPEKARALLLEQRNSEEALEVKQKTDPLYAFCAYLEKLSECTGMLVGNRNPPLYPRVYLYHAYLAFLEANGFDKPLTLNKFAEGMESAMREFNHEYRKERKTRGVVTNVELSGSAEDWLPQPYPNPTKK
ncbi:primase-helicase zinc-binding domain-containing protein [Enterobacter asburiae]|uniref:primase-helicase zinc-binding domain-containing protein n=1 Tax=Enterobacter asburiae TaxID=61645 RepID=UPI001E6B066E|nr:toprim domain-containing protein [Enterobacter asburiae]WMQ95745.1 toprim domain-containing protein [Enterobacter asburiae]BCP71374.1 DNA primase [Enterobacter asburiae]HDT0679141.1 toprim domain-containing protein [Enterobacter asburiae]HDV8911078.1 toprim domain-containing protein [Enterobacter asburiae]HDX4633875.1 toprim domain-containing protein [Enterobacter asburiae]